MFWMSVMVLRIEKQIKSKINSHQLAKNCKILLDRFLTINLLYHKSETALVYEARAAIVLINYLVFLRLFSMAFSISLIFFLIIIISITLITE